MGLENDLHQAMVACGLSSQRGVVAVSGGADSVALLRGLVNRGQQVIVAHFNHRLRGEESDSDAEFVRCLAQLLGLVVDVGTADVATIAQAEKANLEATARRLRYDWLAQVARTHQAAWVATGHSANDQAETLLHRLIRGTGLRGLRGIAAQRPLNRQADEILLIRPLLTVTRDEVLSFLAALNQPFRTDSSNADPGFTRNRIRREVLPLLHEFNPAIVSVLGRLARQATRTDELVQTLVQEVLQEAERPRAGERVILLGAALVSRGETLTAEVLRRIWDREGWPVDGMTAEHWDRAVSIAAGRLRAADFPDGVSLRTVGPCLQLVRVPS